MIAATGCREPRASDGSEPTTAGDGNGALGTIAAASAVPYGYSVTLWASGALLVHYHSFPGVPQIVLFAAGALVGYTLIGLLTRIGLQDTPPVAGGAGPVMLGMSHWFAVFISVGVVALVAQAPGWVAWPLGSMGASMLYLVCAAAELALLTRVRPNKR